MCHFFNPTVKRAWSLPIKALQLWNSAQQLLLWRTIWFWLTVKLFAMLTRTVNYVCQICLDSKGWKRIDHYKRHMEIHKRNGECKFKKKLNYNPLTSFSRLKFLVKIPCINEQWASSVKLTLSVGHA